MDVEDDFELICWDFVSNPSTHGAFMRPVNEGVITEGITNQSSNEKIHKMETIKSKLYIYIYE